MRETDTKKTGFMDRAGNFLDKTIEVVSPQRAARRRAARMALSLSGGYVGASRSDRSLKNFNPLGNDADTDNNWDLPILRPRSRDLYRNAPLAVGAIDTTVMNAVGAGLRHKCEVDRKALGWDDVQAEEWEAATEREFALFAESPDSDTERTLDFYSRQSFAFFQVLLNGDYFELTPRFNRRGFPYSLKLQAVEGDRCCNPDLAADTTTIAGGVEKDAFGAPVKYHFVDRYVLGINVIGAKQNWTAVNAFAAGTGLRQVLHLFDKKRPGQSRGVPMLAPVIRALKQLDMYSDNELKAAIVSSLFTVFIKSEQGDAFPGMMGTGNQGVSANQAGAKDSYQLGAGAIIDLAKGEDVVTADPKRPNSQFDPFVQAIYRHVGIALGIPYEVLIKHFTASYSASQAAILEAWRFFKNRREWFVRNYCRVIYEIWMYEAVALGRVKAPGFFDDPILRKAYLGSNWIGPGRGHIRPDVEQKAAAGRIDMGMTTVEQEKAEYDGGDFQRQLPTIKRERQQLRDAGIGQAVAPNGTLAPEAAPNPDDPAQD